MNEKEIRKNERNKTLDEVIAKIQSSKMTIDGKQTTWSDDVWEMMTLDLIKALQSLKASEPNQLT